MAIRIQGNTVIDDSQNVTVTGVINTSSTIQTSNVNIFANGVIRGIVTTTTPDPTDAAAIVQIPAFSAF